MAAKNYNSIQYLGKQSVFHSIVLYLAATSCTLTLSPTKKKHSIRRKNEKNKKIERSKIKSFL